MAEKVSAAAAADVEAKFGIVPVLKTERVYSLLDLALVSGSFAIATWCYTQGAALASIVTMPQATVSTFGMISCGIAMICLIGVMSNRYGIDHFLCTRGAWGYIGAMIMTPVALSVALGFFTVNISLYGSGMSKLLTSAGWEGAGGTVGQKLIGLTCPLLGLLIAWYGVNAVRWATRIMGAALVVVGVIVLVLIFVRADPSQMWSAAPLGGGEATRTSYMLSVEWNLAFVASWYPCIGAITRITKDGRGSLWGLWFGYSFLMAVYIFIGIAAAFGASSIGAAASGDPTDYLLVMGGAGLGSLTLILVAVANITTAAVGIYALSISMKIVFPALRYQYLAIVIAGLQCGLWLWGGIMTYYGTFLAYGGIICGGCMALALVDYWVVRRRRLDVHSLFTPGKKGKYWFTGGFNLVGLVAFGAGFVAFLLVYDPIAYSPRAGVATSIFDALTATGLLIIVTSAVYVGLSLIPPVRRYLRADEQVNTCC